MPNIDRASEILLSLSDNVGQEVKWIRCQYLTKHKMHVVMCADHTCLARSNNYYTISTAPPPPPPPPRYRRPLDIYVIVSTLILGALWPWHYFLAVPILGISAIMSFVSGYSCISIINTLQAKLLVRNTKHFRESELLGKEMG